MTENEKKETKPEAPSQEAPKEEAPKTEEPKKEEIQPQDTSKNGTVSDDAPKKEEARPEAKKNMPAFTKATRPRECISCNKSIKKKWYYREGGYFCSKACWEKSKKSSADTAEEKKK